MTKKRKQTESEAAEPTSKVNGAIPSTPKRKKASTLPPTTPTPALVGLMVAPRKFEPSTPKALPNRLAVPDGTNATLVTPETHRVMSQKPIEQVSPTKAGTIRTTTANVLEEAVAHLIKTDPRLKPIVDKWPCRVFSPAGLAEEVEPFQSLISGIISQQVCDLISPNDFTF